MQKNNQRLWVQGNSATFAIPLYLQSAGQEPQPYTPPTGSEISVKLYGRLSMKSKSAVKGQGNTILFTDEGSLPADTYDVEVVIKERQDGTTTRKLRSMWKQQLVVLESSERMLAEAVSFAADDTPVLEAGLFFADKGEKGDKGDKGDTGAPGEPGAKGEPGEDLTTVSLTWAQLRELRNTAALTPGRHYRITDYVATTTQQDTRSAGHPFDIIVCADTESTLSETAYAAHHVGDTYFQNARIEAWQLLYCIDNDTDRFLWADTVNGRGVVYGMTDEWGNSLPYDFKNMQFRRCYCEPDEYDGEGRYLAIPGMSVGPDNDLLPAQSDDDYIYAYTFSCLASLDEDLADHPEQADASLRLYQTESEMTVDYNDSPFPSNNIMEPYFVTMAIDDEPLTKVRALPNITFQQFYTDEASCHCSDNRISGLCHDWSGRIKKFYGNDFAEGQTEYCYFSGEVYNSTFSGTLGECTFSGTLGECTFSGYVWYNTFSGYVEYNSFSGDVWYNTFSGTLGECTFSGHVEYSTFSGNVRYNSFSGYVEYNSFSGEVYNSTFSGHVEYSTFSGNIYYSLFKGYSGYVDFVYTGQMRYVTVGGHIVGTDSKHKRANVTGDAKYEQYVTADEQGEVVVTTPWI